MRRHVWLALAVSLYVLSLTLPAFGRRDQPVWGYVCVISLPGAMFFPSWWANPLFLAGCVCLARGAAKGAMALGGLATLFAGSFAMLPRGMEMVQSGYFVWLGSAFVLFAAGSYRHLKPGPA